MKKFLNKIKYLILLYLLLFVHKKYKKYICLKKENILLKKRYENYFLFDEEDKILNEKYLRNFDKKDSKYTFKIKKYFYYTSKILYKLNFDFSYIEIIYFYNLPIKFIFLLKKVYYERFLYYNERIKQEFI